MAGLDLGNVLSILNGSERVQPATLQRFAERFARFNLQPGYCGRHMEWQKQRVYVATREAGQPPQSFISNPKN